ncbi:hypothetical protein PENANT_c005G08020 [Penicillium antarcticum]|uniref:DUF7730 domain-containing protein n=1 Tax=Penicillium antarcticum TaxID=416450 RepID=A0A1V6QEJ8_9EURO|nr:hypothetical protein PENANT_c005G08020 [Penicillium antarcticum]
MASPDDYRFGNNIGPRDRKWLWERLHKHKPSDFSTENLYEAVAESPFYLLPPELRLRILRQAFGDCRVHLHLAGGARSANALVGDVIRNPDRFEWFGRVCDRPPNRKPVNDDCRLALQDTHPRSGQLGVIGWLCSSRLGHMEGTHILYSTNIFFLDDEDLLENIDVVLPAKHLIHIPALEVMMDGKLFNLPEWAMEFATRHWAYRRLERIGFNLKNRFPSLRHSYISLGVLHSSEAREDRDPAVIERIISSIDEIASRMRKDLEVEVALPETFFRDLQRKVSDGSANHYSQSDDGKNMIWKKRCDRV